MFKISKKEKGHSFLKRIGTKLTDIKNPVLNHYHEIKFKLIDLMENL